MSKESKKKKSAGVESDNDLSNETPILQKQSYIVTHENVIPLTIIVSILIALIVFIIACAFSSNIQLVMEPFKLFLEIVILKGFFEIVIMKGLGGTFTVLKESMEIVCAKIYADFSVEKLVIFVSVAVVVRQFPWIADSVVKLLLLSKPPK